MTVGRDATADELAADWVLVHEMVHLALPELGRSHNWLAEGLAVYVEGIARAQFGNRDIGDVWAEYRVLEDLYVKIKATPQMPDLDQLWARLGVPDDPKSQPFDNRAPLAAIRAAITARPSEH